MARGAALGEFSPSMGHGKCVAINILCFLTLCIGNGSICLEYPSLSHMDKSLQLEKTHCKKFTLTHNRTTLIKLFFCKHPTSSILPSRASYLHFLPFASTESEEKNTAENVKQWTKNFFHVSGSSTWRFMLVEARFFLSNSQTYFWESFWRKLKKICSTVQVLVLKNNYTEKTPRIKTKSLLAEACTAIFEKCTERKI